MFAFGLNVVLGICFNGRAACQLLATRQPTANTQPLPPRVSRAFIGNSFRKTATKQRTKNPGKVKAKGIVLNVYDAGEIAALATSVRTTASAFNFRTRMSRSMHVANAESSSTIR